ncbi:MAG: hypothetical protein KA314_13505 [Chloroflexi bacterium]|nr:hypothetical protein [Chloroflexota bacterium]
MATTALIVEMIVIGTFGLGWVALFAFKFFGLEMSDVSGWLVQYKDWSTGIVLIAIVVAYQLGWMVNQLSYFLARNTFNKPIKSKVFKDEVKNYDSIKTMVYMQGSPLIVEKVKERLSVVRLTRSAFVNFLLISIGLFVLEKWQAGLVALGITVVFFILARDMYSLYCNQVFNAYKVISVKQGKQFEDQIKSENLKTTVNNRRAKRRANI